MYQVFKIVYVQGFSESIYKMELINTIKLHRSHIIVLYFPT